MHYLIKDELNNYFYRLDIYILINKCLMVIFFKLKKNTKFH